MNPRVDYGYTDVTAHNQSSDVFSYLPSVGVVEWVAVAFVAFLLLFFGWFVVKQQSVAVVERFGKYRRVAHPGLRFRVPIIDHIAGYVSLRVQQLPVKVDTITKDKVSVSMTVAVQYFVNQNKVYDAFYRLTNLNTQFTAYVFDVVRAHVPKLDLDEVFEKKNEIADEVKKTLSATLDEYGYTIVQALVTDIEPDLKVKAAMNNINAARREQEAAKARGEADKVIRVKAAEAEAESKRLQGEGTGKQMVEIAKGRKQALEELKTAMPEATESELVNFIMMTQYFDTLREIGAQAKSNTLIVPHSPGALSDIGAQIREAVIAGDKVAHAQNGAAH